MRRAPATLIESKLFGHEKGAFTGALSRKVGRFELAGGGTIFLDEIGDLPYDLQSKLLRVLQEGKIDLIGSNRTTKVNVRAIAAANRDIKRAADDGTFRPDLYYRLGVFPIELPPLRERPEDIQLLAWYFISKKQAELCKKIEMVPRKPMEALMSYTWPGNVRELENIIERLIILSPGPVLEPKEFPTTAGSPKSPEADSQSLADMERTHILKVLHDCGWKIEGAGNAADRLSLNPCTLRFRMRKLGIKRPRKPVTPGARGC